MTIPVRLRPTTARLYDRRAELIENLGTKDARQAKALAPAAVARLQAMLDAAAATLSGGERNLTDREVAALAGEFYRDQVAAYGERPGDAMAWDATADRLFEQIDTDGGPSVADMVTPRKPDYRDAAALLQDKRLAVDQDSLERLGRAVVLAKLNVAQLMGRRASGDWFEDRHAARFPPPMSSQVDRPSGGSSCSFDVLLATWALDRGWQVDAKPTPRALYDRQRTLERFAAFVGHRAAERVTKAHAVAFKEDMQRRGRHASTVRNDLSELSALWREGLRLGKLPQGDNPFVGILPPKARKKARDPRAFTDAEAADVLIASRKETGWLRWLPWVLCLTGARLGEVTAAIKEDVTSIDGAMVLRIHDEGEGRSVKNEDSRRNVPLHPALIAEGFADYATGLKAGTPVFHDLPVDGVFGQRAPIASKRLGYWLRQTVKLADPRISPAHSFRH